MPPKLEYEDGRADNHQNSERIDFVCVAGCISSISDIECGAEKEKVLNV